MSRLDLATLLPALGLDLAALTALMALMAWRRSGRADDSITACAAFNVGLFAVAQVLSGVDLGIGAGFGLFAVLSIIRLRSDLFTQGQLAYVFSALAVALVTGFPGVPLPLAAALAGLVVVTVALLELLRGRAAAVHSCTVTLDRVHARGAALVAELEGLGLHVVEVELLEIDAVKETTTVSVRHRPDPGVPSPPSSGDSRRAGGRVLLEGR